MSRFTQDQRLQVATAIASGSSNETAAKLIGASGRTVRSWRLDPEFQAELTTARQQIFDRAVGAAVAASTEAIAGLRAIATDPSASAAARVSAWNSILAFCGRAQMSEMVMRIEALEQALEGEEGDSDGFDEFA